jgi:uncharacterized membrane protein YfcA
VSETDILLIGITVIAGFASGLAGFAFALIATGTMLHLLPPFQAVPLVLASSLVAQGVSLAVLRGDVAWHKLWPFVLGGILGIPLGTELLLIADAGLFRFWLGLFLVAYSLFMLFRRAGQPIRFGGKPADFAIGVIGGIMGGFAGLSGAIPTIWCGLRGWPREEQRGIYQPYIIVIQLGSLLWVGHSVPMSEGFPMLFLKTLPALVIGVWAGLHLYKRIDDVLFRRIILLMLLISGGVLIF